MHQAVITSGTLLCICRIWGKRLIGDWEDSLKHVNISKQPSNIKVNMQLLSPVFPYQILVLLVLCPCHCWARGVDVWYLATCAPAASCHVRGWNGQQKIICFHEPSYDTNCMFPHGNLWLNKHSRVSSHSSAAGLPRMQFVSSLASNTKENHFLCCREERVSEKRINCGTRSEGGLQARRGRKSWPI